MNVQPKEYPLNIPGVMPEDIQRKEGPNSKWIRLRCHWNHQVGNEIKNDYLNDILINANTEKVYNSDKKSDMALKFLGIIVYTPLTLIAKTVYHLILPLSLGHQISKAVEKFKAKEAEAAKNGKEPPKGLALKIVKIVVKNCVDIVKTPLFAVAMTIIAISTLVFAAFKPTFLYEGRVAFGEMLMALNWGKKNTIWTFTPCMQPLANLKKNEKKKFYTVADTIYQGPAGTKIHALNNLARSLLR